MKTEPIERKRRSGKRGLVSLVLLALVSVAGCGELYSPHSDIYYNPKTCSFENQGYEKIETMDREKARMDKIAYSGDNPVQSPIFSLLYEF